MHFLDTRSQLDPLPVKAQTSNILFTRAPRPAGVPKSGQRSPHELCGGGGGDWRLIWRRASDSRRFVSRAKVITTIKRGSTSAWSWERLHCSLANRRQRNFNWNWFLHTSLANVTCRRVVASRELTRRREIIISSKKRVWLRIWLISDESSAASSNEINFSYLTRCNNYFRSFGANI